LGAGDIQREGEAGWGQEKGILTEGKRYRGDNVLFCLGGRGGTGRALVVARRRENAGESSVGRIVYLKRSRVPENDCIKGGGTC